MLRFTLALFLTAITAYGQNQPIVTSTSASDATSPEYIVFGFFCGECSKHCATMYKYNATHNSNTLFVDSTDSYFKKYGNVTCKSQIRDKNKIQLISELLPKIPARFLATNGKDESFGCPDCDDSCGLYLEIKKDAKIRKYYMDGTENLPSDIKDFGRLLVNTIYKLNKK